MHHVAIAIAIAIAICACIAIAITIAINVSWPCEMKQSPRYDNCNGKITIISVEDSYYAMNTPALKVLVYSSFGFFLELCLFVCFQNVSIFQQIRQEISDSWVSG